ncbi:hypothetical protein PIB30_105877, partial [Stylosanthes scabra]|nr:hypothetical protein [Stylosanthes scabra]
MTHLPTYRRTTSTHMRGRHITSMSSQSCPNVTKFSKPKSAMHRRRSPRICVGSQQLTFEAHVGRAKHDSILASPFQSHAYAQNSKYMRGRQAQCPSSLRPT